MVKTIILNINSKDFDSAINLFNKNLKNINKRTFQLSDNEFLLGSFVDNSLLGAALLSQKNKDTIFVKFFTVDYDFISEGIIEGLMIRIEHITRELKCKYLIVNLDYKLIYHFKKHNYKEFNDDSFYNNEDISSILMKKEFFQS